MVGGSGRARPGLTIHGSCLGDHTGLQSLVGLVVLECGGELLRRRAQQVLRDEIVRDVVLKGASWCVGRCPRDIIERAVAIQQVAELWMDRPRRNAACLPSGRPAVHKGRIKRRLNGSTRIVKELEGCNIRRCNRLLQDETAAACRGGYLPAAIPVEDHLGEG